VVEPVPGREDGLGQSDSAVRFEWGPSGAAHLAADAACLVVVDVLSFTTAVTVVVGRGTTVFPYPWNDAGAEDFAAKHDARLAVRRREVSEAHPWSLSPAVLRHAPFTPRLVLPSPNGSTIASGLGAGHKVVAACLRNASAVGRWLLAQGYGNPGRPAVVLASGERWPDGSLRPALEDALGAGAVLGHLRSAGCALSAEAASMATLYEATGDVEGAIRSCGSARQLMGAGYGADVDVAAEVDSDQIVPVVKDGAFSAS